MGSGDDTTWWKGDGATWWTSSVKDPRFTMDGRCAPFVSAMGKAAAAAIRAKAVTLTVDPPDDLEYGGCKD